MDDLESPNRRLKYWLATKREQKHKDNIILRLRKQNLILKKKVTTMEQTIEHLKPDKRITENCFTFLKV